MTYPQGGRPGGNGGGAAPPGGVVGILHVIGGNDRGKAHPLTRGQTTIGRGADQDCILADIAVSRRHIIIAIEGNRYRMKDLGSGNGSLLNGVRTDTAILNDGDQIEIGNTMLRLEHAPSRPQAAAAPPMGGPPMRADSGASTMMAEPGQIPIPQMAPRPAPAPAPSYPAPAAPDPYSAPAGPGGYTPSDAIKMPPSRPISAQASLPAAIPTGSHMNPTPQGGLLDTPVKKIAVFGTVALVVLLAGAVVVKKFVFGGAAEAEKLFRLGTKAYNDGEYDAAKKFFAEAHDLVPENPKTVEYMKQCDLELKAKSLLKMAQAKADAKSWEEAMEALDKIDSSSALSEDKEKLRKRVLPSAVAAACNEARQAIEDNDLETARAKVDAALQLDPDSDAASELDKKLAASGKGQSKEAKERTQKSRERKVEREKKETTKVASSKEPHKSSSSEKSSSKSSSSKSSSAGGGDDDDELAAVPKGSSGGGGDVLGSKAASGPYKSKDFNGAAQALRLQAKGEKGKAAEKDIALAAKVAELGNHYTKAEADKTKNPTSAVNEYVTALNLDATISKGTHTAYFKGQIGKLAKDAAKSAFSQQKWEDAFKNSQNAQKYGGDDGGVGNQLKAKAAELNTKAEGMKKSNLNGAKTLWRQVVKMVPSTDAAYTKAYQSLNQASSAGQDDDE
jgi:tetratricopeptide (TPR) repeat protein